MHRFSRTKVLGPRTTLHIYCSVEEAERVREAARLGKSTMSGFVLHCLRGSWEIEDSLLRIQHDGQPRAQGDSPCRKSLGRLSQRPPKAF